FFKTGRGPNGMHVGIYMSKGKFIHLSTKGGVKEVELNNSYWKARYIGARRY
ncbi:TPA: C40 family peptidase, partial [Campylobacter jejuni]|nr:C40 family peptidase [Campylobacter jejuni]